MRAKRLLGFQKLRDPTEASKFIYEPIPHQEHIRLLELKPGNGPIACQIYPVLLEQAAGSYDAISYCWGDPKNTKAILVNEERIEVTVNLYNALLRLRRESGSKARVLWADAICINQENKEEQSHQVQLMGDVYQCARSVPVWLGLDTQKVAKDCFNLMKETASACRELLAIYGSPARVPRPLPNNPFSQDVKRWERLYDLMSLPWFQRVWVKQEVGLAVRSVLMLGDESIQIQDIVETALFGHDRGDLFPSLQTALYAFRGAFFDIWGTYNNSPSWRDELSPWIDCGIGSFSRVLQQGRYFHASDPRDHVYAFLGHPKALDPNTGTQLITVDYRRSVFDVYYDTTCAILKTWPGELTFLLSCVDRDQKAFDEPYPSWIPRWNQGEQITCFGYPGECKDIPDTEFTLLEDRSLMLSGFVFDEIDWISPPITQSDFETTALLSKIGCLPLFRYILNCLRKKDPLPERIWQMILQYNLGSQYGNGLLDAFFLTMVAGWRTEADEIHQLRSDFYAYCLRVNARIPGPTLDKQMDDIEYGNAALVALNIRWATRGRRFFSTKSGYFGVGRHLIRKGDVCCVFQGTRLPFIIRPAESISCYKFIGDAYIHGVSKGEILEKRPLILQDIILQ